MIANAVSQLEIRLALRLIALEDRAQALLNDPKIRQHMLAALVAFATVGLLLFARIAFGADGAEFASAATTVEGWVKGNPAKVIALAGLLWGTAMAMFKKDLFAFVQPAFIGIVGSLIVGIIDGEYTATI
ncbi:hypothetical protein [Burkholderia glumae]|uniref:Conjugal transfer protein TraA n=2 Tax=Burkholderia glumae TaxID=337 RepID=A0ABY5BBJ8_BURGL|nr:hypothetical protein [Burkholderia glumae]ACR32814.1 Hypothetical protein bglu_3p0380 [Burkholderia glumae BGR1]MCM2496099.1 hypothetical protein [Burkholderia glumae]USS44373.1 hypothetical protein NFI99_13300 [Burkholderia glumae]UVS88476.1 hypothetical protein EFP17_00810 [Burkholderia glumae]UVT00152.1 hypothetical protein EFP19_31350 [Burkholderia glumae]